jgi:MerR family transcriptional regulator, light-induced transcriptional regulator
MFVQGTKEAVVAGKPTDGATEELVQFGDLARRTGLSVDVLRAWERRYGLLRPRRSAGGFRLYSSRDEGTVRAMLAQIDRGFPPPQPPRWPSRGQLPRSHSGPPPQGPTAHSTLPVPICTRP